MSKPKRDLVELSQKCWSVQVEQMPPEQLSKVVGGVAPPPLDGPPFSPPIRKIETEIEAVKRVVDKNIQMSFKTFG